MTDDNVRMTKIKVLVHIVIVRLIHPWDCTYFPNARLPCTCPDWPTGWLLCWHRRHWCWRYPDADASCVRFQPHPSCCRRPVSSGRPTVASRTVGILEARRGPILGVRRVGLGVGIGNVRRRVDGQQGVVVETYTLLDTICTHGTVDGVRVLSVLMVEFGGLRGVRSTYDDNVVPRRVSSTAATSIHHR